MTQNYILFWLGLRADLNIGVSVMSTQQRPVTRARERKFMMCACLKVSYQLNIALYIQVQVFQFLGDFLCIFTCKNSKDCNEVHVFKFKSVTVT